MHILGLAASALTCIVAVVVLRTRHAHRPSVKPGISETSLRLLQRGRRAVLQKLLNVGNFFGIDIGGSLTKLVFFMPDENFVDRMLMRFPAAQRAQYRARYDAISEVAKFILSQVSYGKTGVRDVRLAFDMPDLGGRFHFLRFETRRSESCVVVAQGMTHGMRTLIWSS